MSIRIVSDGHPVTTRVYNSEGYEIDGIAKITWSIDIDNIATATIEFTNVSIDAIAEIKE